MSSVNLKTWVAFLFPFDVVAVVVFDDLQGSRVITSTYLEECLPIAAAVHEIIAVSTVPMNYETVPSALRH